MDTRANSIVRSTSVTWRALARAVASGRMAMLMVLAVAAMLSVPVAAQPPVHVKWTVTVDSISPTQGAVVWHASIDPEWHIYGVALPDVPDAPQATTFDVDDVQGLKWTGPVRSSVDAITHYDDMLELELPWYVGDVEFKRPFTLAAGTGRVSIQGTIAYMACTEFGCTPPATVPFAVKFGGGAVAAAAPVAADDEPADEPEAVTVEEPAAVTFDAADWWKPVSQPESLPDHGGLAIFLLGLLGGLVALLTPCVWPMIPMTVSFFLKTSKNRSRSVSNAVFYGVSIVVIFLALGLTFTLIFGASKMNEIATSAVFNVIFFLLLVFFAISFFGAFDIKLPARWSNAIDAKAENTTGYLSIFFMAFTLVLVSFSCTGPLIGTLLVEAASQGSIVGPALGMGGFALGLALPFAVFAFFPSLLKEMPRSGGWLNSVKVVLGFIELILSLKFLSVADLAYGWGILDREVFLVLWIVLFVMLGMYLIGKLRFSHDAPLDHVSVPRFFMALISWSFAVYLLPGLWGAPLKSISAFAPPLYTQDFNLYGHELTEYDNYDAGMQVAADQGKPVLLDFSGYACVNCRKMEGAVFDTPEVYEAIERNYVFIKLMVDDKAPLPKPMEVEEYGGTTRLNTVGDMWSYLQRHKFGTNQQPYYVILDNQGRLLTEPRAYDEDVKAFSRWLAEGVERYNSL